MRAIGYVLMGVGAFWLLYAFNLETSVVVGFRGDRVQNLALMERRQTHLILATVTVVVGVLLAALNAMQQSWQRAGAPDEGTDDYRPCPHCAEPIRLEATLCRHCRSPVEAVAVEEAEVESSIEPDFDPNAIAEGSCRELARAVEGEERNAKEKNTQN